MKGMIAEYTIIYIQVPRSIILAKLGLNIDFTSDNTFVFPMWLSGYAEVKCMAL